jgi:quercetin dioxygenase-like cupin family protein
MRLDGNKFQRRQALPYSKEPTTQRRCASGGTISSSPKRGTGAPIANKRQNWSRSRVLAAIDLEKEPGNIKDRQLRFRKLTIEPGDIVPWHSHGDRPAIIYVAEGEIVEYASNCSAPIMHKTGDIRPETSGTSHWWQNLGKKTVVLFIGDVLHAETGLASYLWMRKLSRFFPAFTAATIHLGIAPRPAHVSDRFFGLRYLGSTFLPLSALPFRRPTAFLLELTQPPSPRAASWLCN